MIKQRDVAICHLDGWSGLYIDGRLEIESHSLTMEDAFIILGIEFETTEPDCFGKCPPTWAEAVNLNKGDNNDD